MSGGPASNIGATSASVSSNRRLDEAVFNDYHLSCFMAMETVITIVPRFSLPRVDCLGGLYGPFEPNYPVDVPLWLALHLRQTDTCTVNPPPYLRLPFLNSVLAKEQASDSSFEALPFYFFEVAKKLCETGGGGGGGSGGYGGRVARSGGGGGGGAAHAADDIPHVAEVVRLVQEIKSVRQRKLKQSMGVFEPEGSAMFIPGIRLTHIISNELHFLRTSFAVVLQQAANMEHRRARPAANFLAGGYRTGAAAVPRLPHVASLSAASVASSVTATPARPSTFSTSSSLPTTTTAGVVEGDDASLVGPSSSRAGDAAAISGIDQGDGATHDAILTQTTEATTAATVAPLVQPPAKKRRTLRQT